MNHGQIRFRLPGEKQAHGLIEEHDDTPMDTGPYFQTKPTVVFGGN